MMNRRVFVGAVGALASMPSIARAASQNKTSMRIYTEEQVAETPILASCKWREGPDHAMFYCPYVPGQPLPEPPPDIARVDDHLFHLDNRYGLSDHSFNALKWILANTLREERQFSYGTGENATIDIWFRNIDQALLFERMWITV